MTPKNHTENRFKSPENDMCHSTAPIMSAISSKKRIRHCAVLQTLNMNSDADTHHHAVSSTRLPKKPRKKALRSPCSTSQSARAAAPDMKAYPNAPSASLI